jgi:hypothetical protein
MYHGLCEHKITNQSLVVLKTSGKQQPMKMQNETENIQRYRYI